MFVSSSLVVEDGDVSTCSEGLLRSTAQRPLAGGTEGPVVGAGPGPLEDAVPAGEARGQEEGEVVVTSPPVSQREGGAASLLHCEEVVVQALLGGVLSVLARTHGEGEVAGVVGGDLHTDLHPLAGAVGGHHLPRGVLTAGLVFPGPVVRVSTQSTPASVDLPLHGQASTEPLIVLIVRRSVVTEPPHRCSGGRLD